MIFLQGIVKKGEQIESGWRNFVAAYVAALSHFVKKIGVFVLLNKIHTFLYMLSWPCLLIISYLSFLMEMLHCQLNLG